MKIINEKGKLFGIINIIDLIVIIVVVLLIGGGIKRVKNSEIEVEEKVEGVKKEALITFEVEKLKKNVVDEIVIGDLLYNNEKETTFGKIVDKKVEEQEDKPDLYKVVISIESKVEDTPKAIIIGDSETRVGSELVLKNKRVKIAGTVINVEVE
ncbi:MAG: DUF4330 domain-containing protein [Clostridiaceae bacterium]|nr:DUF4330 domain-containing protein [Clostridiaceae bacterium]MBW4860288.1 DUF4330 domain-containing protein [Clostridiaceae bacterium]MBW4868922.1 DUF4330 domain-containing protein [Clostridiaceae bacterium]